MNENTREIIVSKETPEIVVVEHMHHTNYPEHWHLFAEAIYATKDGGVLDVRGTTYSMKKGDILIIWPTELHSIISSPIEGAILIQFSADFIRDNPEIYRHFRSMQGIHHITAEKEELRKKVENSIFQLARLRRSSSDFMYVKMKLELYHMIIALATEARDHAAELNQGLDHISHQSDTYLKIQAACKYISDNCEKDLMQVQVSDYIGFSSYYFSRIFKKYTGESYSEYLTQQRIRKAVEMLSSDNVPITEVGFYAGFQSVSNFNRAFKSIMNCSPTQFRKMHASGDHEEFKQQ